MSASDRPDTAWRLSRRTFAGAGIAAVAASQVLSAEPEASRKGSGPLIQPGQTVLFQGDSITDAGRKRDATSADANSQAALGDGYAWLAASQLLVDRADDKLRIFNRGISGNKIPDLADRWQADCLDIKPDALSILIGVNDFWHKQSGDYEGDMAKYESGYQDLIKRTQDALPNVKLVICEPFILLCGAVKEEWLPEFDTYRAAAKRIADQAEARFVPFHEMFTKASKIAPPERWAADGVHPTADGAALMAHAWRQIVDG